MTTSARYWCYYGLLIGVVGAVASWLVVSGQVVAGGILFAVYLGVAVALGRKRSPRDSTGGGA